MSLSRQKIVGFICWWWCFGWVEVFLLFEGFFCWWFGVVFGHFGLGFCFVCLVLFFRLALFFPLLSKPPVKFLLAWNEWSLTWHIWEQSPACQSCWSAAAPKKPQLLWLEGKDRASSLSLGSAKGADRNLWAHQKTFGTTALPRATCSLGITKFSILSHRMSQIDPKRLPR